MLRRTIAIVMLMLLTVTALSGCRRLVTDEDESVCVYATFWPVYALTEAVARDIPNLSLKLLVQPQDDCLRNYRLSDWDAALLAAGADGVVMGGRGLESFESTLFGWGENGPAIAALLYNLELYNQDDATDGETESHLRGANPHLYLSVEGAQRIVDSASASMQSLDPQYADRYVANAQAAAARLEALLADNRALLSDFKGAPVALMNETLVYVARDYGLEIAAQIDRESAASMGDNELEACLRALELSGAKVVLIEKQAPQALTEALEAAGYVVARIDIMSTHREGEGFDTYIDIQAANVQAVRDAFTRAATGEAAH